MRSIDVCFLNPKILLISDLVGGFKHLEYCPFHIWDVILPIDELHHFSRWERNHQLERYLKITLGGPITYSLGLDGSTP